MPINPNALSAPEPDEDAAREQGLPTSEDAKTMNPDVTEPPKRTRRKKSEMIADAVVPGMDDVVEIKDAASGAKISRPWRVAVEMFRDEKATYLDKPQEYAFLKYEQQRAESASAAAAHSDAGEDPANPEPDPATAHDASGQQIAPDGAQLGDEVVIGPDTFTVGHGHVLVKGVVAVDGEIVQAKRRWKREIGDPDGPFVAEKISHPSIAQRAGALEHGASNGKADDVKVETERLPREMDELGDGTIKITTGILEKIGLPQVEQYAGGSQLQIGPISISRLIVDDGRRDVVEFSDGRTGEVITAAVEGFDLIDNTAELVAARFRGQLVAFLAALGVLRQPVSS